MWCENEVWRAVDDTNGMIEVSNYGRVRSLLRDGRVLKTQRDKKGYFRCRVTVLCRKITFKVHRAVANAFIPNPLGLPQVNHKDGNKANNTISNLEWVSCAENAQHAMRHGLWKNVLDASKRANEKRKIPVCAINIKTGDLLFFDSVSEAERAIGTKHVSACIKGRRRQACGYIFRLAEGGDLPYGIEC